MTAVAQPQLQGQLHQLLSGWAHILIALTEGHDREAHALQVLYHLDGSPVVKGNLTDIETFAQLLNELFNVVVVDDIALGGLHEALPLPHIIGNMVTLDAKVNGFLRYPEIREDGILVVLILRRE